MSAFQEIKSKNYEERTELENAIICAWATSYSQTAIKAAEQLATLETNCANAIQANIEVAQLNVALQEKIEEYTEVYNRVMAEQCAPDEQHCTCVPALRMEITTLQTVIKQVEANYNALQMLMPCGHLARYAVNGEDGTQYCCMCDRNAQMIVLENVTNVLNKTADCIILLREIDQRVEGLSFDYYDDNSVSMGERVETALKELDKEKP